MMWSMVSGAKCLACDDSNRLTRLCPVSESVSRHSNCRWARRLPVKESPSKERRATTRATKRTGPRERGAKARGFSRFQSSISGKTTALDAPGDAVDEVGFCFCSRFYLFLSLSLILSFLPCKCNTCNCNSHTQAQQVHTLTVCV